MESASRHTLIVANLTASTPILLQEIQRRADASSTDFELLVPNVASSKYSDWSLDAACKLLGRAAGSPVKGRTGSGDPFESVREAVADGSWDEIIISTLPKGRSEWLRKDLPSRVEELGVPVTVITAPAEPSGMKAFADSFSAKTPPPSQG